MKNGKTAPIVIPTKRSARRNPLFYCNFLCAWAIQGISRRARNDKGGMQHAKCEIRNRIRNLKFEIRNTMGFSLVELIIVIAVIGILSSVSYFAIQGSAERAKNARMTDDLLVISSALEEYKLDHDGKYPVPVPSSTSAPYSGSILCFYIDSTYAHDCAKGKAAFVQSQVSVSLLSSRYLRTVPTDPRTGSPYTYSVTSDGGYYQIAGISEEDSSYTARIIGNLSRGFSLPSIIRSYNSDEFVTDKGKHLPYSPSPNELTGTLRNVKGTVIVPGKTVSEGLVVSAGDTVKTNPSGSADIFFSDGSVTHIDPNTTLTLKSDSSSKNDSKGTITKIILNLKSGKIWNKVARLSSNSSFDVETSSAIAGVRGTEFGVEADSSGNLKEITVLSGSIKVDHNPTSATPSFTTKYIPADSTKSVDPAKPQTAVLSGGLLTITDAILSTIVSDYYKNIPLNSTMVPRILSVKYDSGTSKGIIKVRDVDYYTEKLDTVTKRTVDATDLAVYTNSTGAGTPAQTVTLAGKTPPYTIDSLAVDTKYYLRFEKRDSGTVTHSSSFTIPITIKSSTNLTESEIYASQSSSQSQTTPPVLSVSSYNFAMTGEIFPLEMNLSPYTFTNGDKYDITANGGCTPISTTIALTQPSGAKHTVQITAPSSVPASGKCVLTVKAHAGGTVLTKVADVRIFEKKGALGLTYPQDNSVLYKAGKEIEFRWNSPNPPVGTVYKITVTPQTSGVTTQVSEATVSSGLSYKTTGSHLAAGTYKWKVKMFDSQNTKLGEKEHTFTVSAGGSSVVDFDIKSGTSSIFTPPSNQATINMSQSLIVDSIKPTSGSNYKYSWNFSGFTQNQTPTPTSSSPLSPFTATIPDPGIGNSKYYGFTLTVRDQQDNMVGTVTKGVTVSKSQEFSNFVFNTPTNSQIIPGTDWEIPGLKISNITPVITFTPDKCDTLTSSIGTVKSGTGTSVAKRFVSITSGSGTVTITCTVNAGKIIGGYAASNTIQPVAMSPAPTVQGPTFTASANPASVILNSTTFSVITTQGSTGTVTCIPDTVGRGKIVKTGSIINYNPEYTNTIAMNKFATINKDIVTITCTDSATTPQTATATIIVNYKPFKTSSNYMYSYFGESGKDWNTANANCTNLNEGGYNWQLPLSSKLVLTQEKGEWCGGASSCPNMPNGAKTHWAEEVSLGSTDANVVLGTLTFSGPVAKNTTQSTYGYRCVRNLSP